MHLAESTCSGCSASFGRRRAQTLARSKHQQSRIRRSTRRCRRAQVTCRFRLPAARPMFERLPTPVGLAHTDTIARARGGMGLPQLLQSECRRDRAASFPMNLHEFPSPCPFGRPSWDACRPPLVKSDSSRANLSFPLHPSVDKILFAFPVRDRSVAGLQICLSHTSFLPPLGELLCHAT
jgi:hypothetical protein